MGGFGWEFGWRLEGWWWGDSAVEVHKKKMASMFAHAKRFSEEEQERRRAWRKGRGQARRGTKKIKKSKSLLATCHRWRALCLLGAGCPGECRGRGFNGEWMSKWPYCIQCVECSIIL